MPLELHWFDVLYVVAGSVGLGICIAGILEAVARRKKGLPS